MKILGHPVHMMLIHFPSALFPMDFIGSALGFYTGNTLFIDAAFLAMVAGVLLGIAAIVTGTWDLMAVVEQKPLALKKALVHGGINTAVVIGYSILAFRAYKMYPDVLADTMIILVVKTGLITFMIVGNYLGGSLILKYRVGLDND